MFKVFITRIFDVVLWKITRCGDITWMQTRFLMKPFQKPMENRLVA